MKCLAIICMAWSFLCTMHLARSGSVLQDLGLEDDVRSEVGAAVEEMFQGEEVKFATAKGEDATAVPSGKQLGPGQGLRTIIDTIVGENYNFTGPYAFRYFDDDQCDVIAIIPTHLRSQVWECETICAQRDSCSAFNWRYMPESERGHGCVLRNCGPGRPPFPSGRNTDWLSFSERLPIGL